MCRLFWKDRHVADIENPRLLHFPWVIGDLRPVAFDDTLREVLEWFGRTVELESDELEDPPFADDLVNEWWIELSDGSRHDISVPLIDSKDGTITWR